MGDLAEGQQRVRGGDGRYVPAAHARPRDPDMPLLCLDETSKQLMAETRAPIKMKGARPARFDCEYERNGAANLFMMFAPLEGWRRVEVTDRHTALDYARAGRYPLLERQENRIGARQLSARRGRPERSAQHPHQGFAL